jgi:hypothetical protein
MLPPVFGPAIGRTTGNGASLPFRWLAVRPLSVYVLPLQPSIDGAKSAAHVEDSSIPGDKRVTRVSVETQAIVRSHEGRHALKIFSPRP